MHTSTRTLNAVHSAVFVVLLGAVACSAQYDLYAMGSSNVNHIDGWLNAFLEMSDTMSGDCDAISLAGAPMHWIWDVRADQSPNPETYLQTTPFDIVYMVASTVWIARQQEAPPCVSFANAAIQGNPDVRVFIQERKYVEPYVDGLRYCYFWDENCDANLTIEYLFRPHYLKTIHDMATELGRKVYVAPTGSCLDAAKQMAENGLLDGYTDRLCIYQSQENQHLSPFGHYVHAAAVWAATYQLDPRPLPRIVTRYGGADTMVVLTEHDADLVKQMVYDSVRGTPFSGWYENEPATYDEYMDSLWAAIRNFETFDNGDTAGGDGAFAGQNGQEWTFHNARAAYESWLTISGETMLLDAGEYAPGGEDKPFVSTLMPNGVSWLTFQYRGRYKIPGPADTYTYKLAVVADGDTLAVLDKIIEEDTSGHRVGAEEYGCVIEDIDLPPGGELKFVSLGSDAVRLDNIRWLDYDGATDTTPASSAVQRSTGMPMCFTDGILHIGEYAPSQVSVTTLDGRMVACRSIGSHMLKLDRAAGICIVTVATSHGTSSQRILAR